MVDGPTDGLAENLPDLEPIAGYRRTGARKTFCANLLAFVLLIHHSRYLNNSSRSSRTISKIEKAGIGKTGIGKTGARSGVMPKWRCCSSGTNWICWWFITLSASISFRARSHSCSLQLSCRWISGGDDTWRVMLILQIRWRPLVSQMEWIFMLRF
jgi:hypothetical protein